MDLKNIVIHQIIKEPQSEVILNCSKALLPIKSDDIIEFVNRFLKIYNLKRPTQGTFKENKKDYPFQVHAQEYLNEGDFLVFSINAMKTLEKAIDLPSTKGGYVIFFHYEQNREEFLVTTMLDNSTQFAVDETALIIERLTTLNLDQLVRANRVNLNKWQNNEEAYLSFIKGKRAVSKFFQVFIGNTDLTSSLINANNLKLSIQDFMSTKGYNQSEKNKIYSNIKKYVDKRIALEEDIELTSISGIIDIENPEDFIDYTIDNNKNVSGRFRSNKKTDFKFLYQSTITDDGLKIDFDKALVQSGKIVRTSANSITINDLDSKVLDIQVGKVKK